MTDGCTPIGLGCELCPVLPAVAYSPAYFMETAAYGWDSGAVSDDELDGNVHVVFTMEMVFGVVCGLTPDRTGVGFARITKGFYFHNDGSPKFNIMENGIIISGAVIYTPGDEFEIIREFGIVRYYQNSTLLFESGSTSTGLISVGASLYLSGDSIPDIEFEAYGTGIVSGDCEGSLIISGFALQSAITGYAVGYLIISGEGTMIAGFEDEIPVLGVPTTAIGYLLLTGESEGSLEVTGNAEGDLYIDGLGAYGTIAEGALYISGNASSEFVLGSYGFIVSTDPVMFGYAGFESLIVQEDIAFGTTDTMLETAVARVMLGFSWDGITQAEVTNQVFETLGIEDSVAIIVRVMVEEGLIFEGELTGDYRALERVVNTLMLVHDHLTEADALSVVVETITFNDVMAALAKNIVSESFTVQALVDQTLIATQQLIEGILMTETLVNTVTGMVINNEILSLSDTPVTQGEFFTAVREGLGFVLNIDLDNGQFIAWSMEVDKKGLSKYTEYPFNSFCKLGTQYFGATDEGIFLMEGSDDDGANIQARIRLAMTTMGSMAHKAIPVMYLGYTASNGLYIKAIITDKNDEYVAHIYKLKPQATNAMRTARVKLGDGLQSVYFGWEIENVDGGDLNIDHIQWLPMNTDRKVRGQNGRS